MTFGEILSRAAVNTCLGMGTVFVMLFLISAIIFLFKYIPKKTAPAPETKPQAADAELIPAIIAAVLAASKKEADEEDEAYLYVVRSIKRR